MRIRQKLAAIGAALVVAATGAVVAAPAAEAAPARYYQCTAARLVRTPGSFWVSARKWAEVQCKGRGYTFRVGGFCSDGSRGWSPWTQLYPPGQMSSPWRKAVGSCPFWSAGRDASHPVGPARIEIRAYG